MSFLFKAIPSVLVFFLAAPFFGQPPADAVPALAAPSPSATLQPALSDVQSATMALNISKWKIPGTARKAAQEDVNSIQRDLGSTLPGLLAQADAAPGSVPPSFAVYRNLNALYDVLLRVSQTADLAAPSNEAASVASSLRRLEAARKTLGDSILNTSQRHEAQIIALTAAVKTAKASAPEHKRETVIDDGPEKIPAGKTRHKTVHKKPAPKSPSGRSS